MHQTGSMVLANRRAERPREPQNTTNHDQTRAWHDSLSPPQHPRVAAFLSCLLRHSRPSFHVTELFALSRFITFTHTHLHLSHSIFETIFLLHCDTQCRALPDIFMYILRSVSLSGRYTVYFQTLKASPFAIMSNPSRCSTKSPLSAKAFCKP